MENAEIARRLEQVTGLLEAQRANPSGSKRTTALQWVLGILISIWPISDASRARGRRSWRPKADGAANFGDDRGTLDQLRGENGFFALLESVPGIGCVWRSGFMVSLESTRSRSGQMTDGLAIPWESKKLTGVTSSAVRGSVITMHQPHRFLKFRIA